MAMAVFGTASCRGRAPRPCAAVPALFAWRQPRTARKRWHGRAGQVRMAWLRSPAMSSLRSDEDLMLAYAGGEAAAFDELYQRHRQRLWRYLDKLLRQPALVEEIFQETWERAIAARARYSPDAPFGAWLYRIAYRLALDLLRRQRPQTSIDESVIELAADQPDPAAWLQALDDAGRLHAALDELPHEQKAALLLQVEEELSLEQIAQISECGRETIKSRLRYAMNRLRSRLRREQA